MAFVATCMPRCGTGNEDGNQNLLTEAVQSCPGIEPQGLKAQELLMA